MCDFFFFKQKTAYEMRISDWSSDVCSSDLLDRRARQLDRTADGLEAAALRMRHLDDGAADAQRLVVHQLLHVHDRAAGDVVLVEQIGRASCRERVCQYV